MPRCYSRCSLDDLTHKERRVKQRRGGIVYVEEVQSGFGVIKLTDMVEA